MDKKKNPALNANSPQVIQIVELDDGNLGNALGTAAETNIFGCTNPTDCSGTSNFISCKNERTCLVDS